MKSIFIVLGVTGENDEQRSWLVKAFPSEKEALSFIDKLEAAYESSSEEDGEAERLSESMKALDENFEFDPETGTEYSITECPFEGQMPTPSRASGDRPFSSQERAPSRDSKGSGRKPSRR